MVLVHFWLRRLVNLGMSRWWYLAVFAPVVNLWVAYRCFACPPGYASHKKMDFPGILIAVIYWFVMLAGALMLASFFGSPDPGTLVDQAAGTLRAAIASHAKR